MIEIVLQHLETLVGFDTRNPPRAIGSDGIFGYIRAQLPGFVFDLQDHGAGAVGLLAKRGTPKTLFNVHLDTVPSSEQWSADPLRLRLMDDRAIGLGACDIKGAAAALLAAASASSGDAALLFTSDEEANDARCIGAFLKSDHGFENAIIAEPTQAEAVLTHRGIAESRLRTCCFEVALGMPVASMPATIPPCIARCAGATLRSNWSIVTPSKNSAVSPACVSTSVASKGESRPT